MRTLARRATWALAALGLLPLSWGCDSAPYYEHAPVHGKVTYKGKDYYVCCSGCRDEFKANPEKYIKEAEAKAKEKK